MITSTCLAAVLAFFVQFQIPLHVVPSIVMTNDIQSAGYYRDGVVYLKSTADCGVLAHEMFHHIQAEKDGAATGQIAWMRRESEARRLELMFRGQD